MYSPLTPLPPDFIFGVKLVGINRRSKPTFKADARPAIWPARFYFEVSKGGGVLYSRIETYEVAPSAGVCILLSPPFPPILFSG